MNAFKTIYQAERLPVLQNRMFASESEARACARGDMRLVQDQTTGIISNQAFDQSLMRYDADYQNEQAVSGVFQQHLEDVSEIISKHFCGKSLIEVGCGKAHFLERLQKLGFDITGMDPAYEGSNPSILKRYFTSEVGLRADALVLRHVLEHVPHPLDFLNNLREANGGGVIYIEVPCFDWIGSHRSWFDIFYEHVNYFRLADFHRMFETVYESGHIFRGQYLYVVAELASLRQPVRDDGDVATLPDDFLDTVSLYASRLKQRSVDPGPGSAIWGGASKGVIFSLLMERAGAKVDMVVDINPAKQGKFLAATGLRVFSPPEAVPALPDGADIFVMNSNYLDEIRKLTRNRFNYLLVEHDCI